MVALLLPLVSLDVLQTRETGLQLQLREALIKGDIKPGGCIPQLFELDTQRFQLDLHRTMNMTTAQWLHSVGWMFTLRTLWMTSRPEFLGQSTACW